jgi:DNA-binding MarR family transcriptional regulator
LDPSAAPRWTVFSNHGHVLIYVGHNPDARVRDVAAAVGITERTTQTILHDLDEAGYIKRTHTGRRVHYRILRSALLRHPIEARTSVGTILDAVIVASEDRTTGEDHPHLAF